MDPWEGQINTTSTANEQFLVGREPELRLLRNLLAATASGQGNLALIKIGRAHV